MNYTYVIKHHKIPVVLEKETGFYARIDQMNSRIGNAVRSININSKFDFQQLETDKKAHVRIREWIKGNHPEFLL